ncbi:hypothetical protein LX64_04998 [Chitinophaga skermanii]|uniref:Uncharacterized protein n=1 Tax=Chitinophaga skermanii TaxID=331697 RepID=A0A327Q1E7_9BACT|nr:hypothetical protein LX64_04998 [Chitinophaga skermanii]
MYRWQHKIRDNKLLKGIAAVLKDLREAKDVSLEEVYNDTNNSSRQD